MNLRTACLALCGAVALNPSAAGQTPITVDLVVSGLDKPILVTSPPGDYERLFVLEKDGLIKIIWNKIVLPLPFLDLSSKVQIGWIEGGLLGMAFHPDYNSNGFFYVSYTRQGDGATMVERYSVSSHANLAEAESGVPVLGPVPQPLANHNGGHIAFGPDGKLYVGLGDGGAAGGIPACTAQDGASLLGKILRLNDDGSVPKNNPFVGNPSIRDEVWAYGLRNPWRFSFDRETGDLYITDVGHAGFEEIDFQPALSPGGQNYGWHVMEGAHCFGAVNCPTGPACFSPSLTLPIHEYQHINGACCIIGGHVYRGCQIQGLQGTYFYGDFCTGQTWSFRYDGANISDFQEQTAALKPKVGTTTFITSFGEDADGELYICYITGEVWKIVPDGPAPFVDLGFALPGTRGEPVLDVAGLLGTTNIAKLRLRNALPNTLSLATWSLVSNPTQLYGGTLVPDPLTAGIATLETGPIGELSIRLYGAPSPLQLYLQFLIFDTGAVEDIAFSNAIRIDWR